MAKLALGIPKGSLQEATIEMMKRAGWKVRVPQRSYYPSIDDEELEGRLIRPQDMSRYVEKGIIDAGLTGADWVKENGSDVKVVASLVYAKQQLTKVRWVMAVPEDSSIRKISDLSGKRIATELVNVTRSYLLERGVRAEIEFSHGATEAKAPHLVDAIVELTETGASLKANNLRILDTVMESTTLFIANHNAWKDLWKKHKIENLAMLFTGAIIAGEKVGLKMNVPGDCLEAVLKKLPALRRPTVSPLAEGAGYAIETVIDESVARRIIPDLKRAGAEGIIEYSLNKVIL
ncbi:MAG TPA: ATP phosphoribosyltransferase [Candidatus Hypogeohydataceae bacterium YC41]